MNGFRNWIARYMTGRYGSDELNRFLLIICAILLIIGIFVTRRTRIRWNVFLRRAPAGRGSWIWSRPRLRRSRRSWRDGRQKLAQEEAETCSGKADLHLPGLQGKSAGAGWRRAHPDQMPPLRK